MTPTIEPYVTIDVDNAYGSTKTNNIIWKSCNGALDMGLFYLLINIVATSAGGTFDKMNFVRTKISPQLMISMSFATMSLVIGLYILIAQVPFPELTVPALIISSLIAVISATANIFDSLSLKVDDMSLREPLVDFGPILAGILAYTLFPDERKPIYLAAFIVGGLIVYWGIHRRKLRKSQSRGMHYLLIATALYAILPSIYQQAFAHMSPEYVAFFRLTAVFLLLMVFFRQKKFLQELTPHRIWYGLLSGTAWSIAALTSLFAIQFFGVVLSMLLLALGPALRYLAGWLILKEKVRKGEVLASFMLTVVICLAAFLG